ADEFRRRRGYDLLSRLPALWDADGPEGERVRADYHAVRAALAEEAWFKPQAAWFSRYGMICGFDTDDGARYAEPVNAVVRYADYPRTHRWYGAPGTDHRGDPKFYSSLAHLYGLPRVWLEAFHSSGWGATPEETFDWLLPWLRAGATLWDPHAVYYSTRGGWWEWAPLSYCWRQPYWRHFRLLTLAVTRLGWLLSQGRHVCDIAVLYPTAAVHAHLTPTGPLPEATAISAAYLELVGRLTWEDKRVGALDRERRDFDVVDDASVQQSQVADGLLVIGSEQYGVVILPRCTALERATAARLCAFVEAGGRLVAVGEAPALEVDGDGAQVGRLRALLESGRAICVAGAADVPAALADRPRAIEAPVPVLHRRDGDRAIVFVSAAFPGAAQVDGRIPDIQVDLDHARYARTMRLRVTGVTGDPDLWDPFTGERCCVPARAVPGGVEVDVTFPHGPAAVLVWPGAPSSPRLLPAPIRVWQRVDGPWAVRLEPTLDNRFGDFALPAHAGAPPVQTWRFEHRLEPDGVDGLAAGWWGGGAPAGGR
ncbi:MAG: hypothetical protein FJ029_16070, partial [Actinobacteria bacterium]|nr:hypothetical protein [Actinomycetota bacterium]